MLGYFPDKKINYDEAVFPLSSETKRGTLV